MNKKLTLKHWLSFIIAGLVGQFAWTIENMFINLYLFDVTNDSRFVAPMVALSAAVATITTLLMGALSDRLGKRKLFISFGYIIWGISILSFALLNPRDFPILTNSTFLCGVLIVVIDCVMTFFGSTANDACFNAYVTDVTHKDNRGKVESVLSVLPLVSMLIIFGLCGGLTNKSDPKWGIFFLIFGGLTIVAGIASIFLLPKDENITNKEEPYFKNIFYGFRPSVIKANPLLYLSLISFCVFSIAIQIFFPYFLIYIQEGLKIIDLDFTLTLGSVLLISCVITVIVGLFMDKIGRKKIIIPSVIVAAIGALLMFFAKDMAFIIVSGTILITGYMVSTAVMGAEVRDYTPKDQVGLFQGIRMIFVVLIPMVTGPFIGELLYLNSELTYKNDYGELVRLPNENIFLGAMVALLLSLIPIIITIIKERKKAHE